MRFRQLIFVKIAAICVGILLGHWMIDKPSKPVTITFAETSRFSDALILPEESLIEEGSKSYLYTVHKSIVSKQKVEIGGKASGKVEILEGLKGYETIVLEGPEKLKKGDFVRSVVSI